MATTLRVVVVKLLNVFLCAARQGCLGCENSGPPNSPGSKDILFWCHAASHNGMSIGTAIVLCLTQWNNMQFSTAHTDREICNRGNKVGVLRYNPSHASSVQIPIPAILPQKTCTYCLGLNKQTDWCSSFLLKKHCERSYLKSSPKGSRW